MKFKLVFLKFPREEKEKNLKKNEKKIVFPIDKLKILDQ